ncbi:11875_t:CDS:2, partial [Ambispora leptoticha]
MSSCNVVQHLRRSIRQPVQPQQLFLRPYTNSTFRQPPSEESISSSNMNKYLDKFGKTTAKRIPTAIFAKLIVIGLVGLMSVDLLYARYRNRCNEHRLIETVEKGTQPEIGDEFIPRPLLEEGLKQIFHPPKNHSSYHVVCGEHGTGKTTLTRLTARKFGQGVIYVDVPANLDEFGDEFGKALNFTFEEHISFTGQLLQKILGRTKEESKHHKWVRAMGAFKLASAVYKKKQGKPPVIVYDNVSRLVHKNPDILDTLQDDAKDNADFSKYIAVFVCSEGSVPRRME